MSWTIGNLHGNNSYSILIIYENGSIFCILWSIKFLDEIANESYSEMIMYIIKTHCTHINFESQVFLFVLGKKRIISRAGDVCLETKIREGGGRGLHVWAQPGKLETLSQNINQSKNWRGNCLWKVQSFLSTSRKTKDYIILNLYCNMLCFVLVY